MTSLMTHQLLLLIALLLRSIVPTETKVVKSMAECDSFFLNKNSPNIPEILEEGIILDQARYKVICQFLNGISTFVTLYDTRNKIPVFSAAKFRGDKCRKPSDEWMIEPQLENNENMREETSITLKNQASNIDYANSYGFTKGQLFPSTYGFTEVQKRSTFTLTNVIPQNASFNKGSWKRVENCIECVMNNYCSNNSYTEAFVVTGAQPSNKKTLNNGLNVPDRLWSAFCCYSDRLKKWLASAHWGWNNEYNKV